MPVPYTSGTLTGFDIGSSDGYLGLFGASNLFIGDAGINISGFAHGGDDSFTLAEPFSFVGFTNFCYGDAWGDITGFGSGGNDTFNVSTQSGHNTLFGDAGGNISGFAAGGNDAFNLSTASCF